MRPTILVSLLSRKSYDSRGESVTLDVKLDYLRNATVLEVL